MTGAMRAARFHGVRDVRIDEVTEPEVRPGAVKIAVAWCGICGTDLHEYLEGPIFIPPSDVPHPLTGEASPVTLGHEFSGTVEALGEGVTDLTIGDRVVVEPYTVCDACPPCRAGDYHLCTQLGVIGLAGGGGGLSEKVVVDRRWVHPVGNIPLDHAALIEPLSVARHAVVRSGVSHGATAVIGGAGPIGLLVAAVLADLGVTTIITEISAARKKRAQTIADHVLDPTDVDVHARVLELTHGVGADVGFECAGVDAVMDHVLDAVRPAGVVVNVSIWGRPAAIDMQKLVVKEIDLRGSFAYVRDYPESIALVQRRGVDLGPFITSRISLEHLVTHGLTTLSNDADTAVKILVHP